MGYIRKGKSSQRWPFGFYLKRNLILKFRKIFILWMFRIKYDAAWKFVKLSIELKFLDFNIKFCIIYYNYCLTIIVVVCTWYIFIVCGTSNTTQLCGYPAGTLVYQRISISHFFNKIQIIFVKFHHSIIFDVTVRRFTNDMHCGKEYEICCIWSNDGLR